MGFYPTPETVTKQIIERIAAPIEGNILRLLDPCAGEGIALAQVAEQMALEFPGKVESYGIEPDDARAEAAKTRLNHVVKGGYETVMATNDVFSLLFYNPPYDDSTGEDGKGERNEYRFLKDQSRWLCPGGLLVCIVPQKSLSCMANLLVNRFEDFRVERFGDKESPLRRPANKSLGETKMKPRLHPAELMKKMLKGYFDLFIADELHQMRGNSSQGEAYGQLVCCAKLTLNLTGTLTGGKAGDLYRLLERSDIKPLLEDGFVKGEIAPFIATYGVLQEIRKSEEDGAVFSETKKERRQVREIPGLSPSMFVKFLLDRSIFIELSDLGLPLVELKEEPIFIDLDPRHKAAYDTFHNALHTACSFAAREGHPGAYGKFILATLLYADRPFEASVKIGDTVITAPAIPGYSAKERQLIRDVKQELSEGRGVMVFCHYTGIHGTDTHLQNILAENGIDSVVLKSSVSPEDRMDWLDEQATKGTKVIICNMKLVEVGLDIIQYPACIFYQGSYEVYTVRQASRRAWRIGQHRECRIKYYVCTGTQSQKQFETILARRCHALILEGRLDKSELARFVKDDSFSALTQKIATDLTEIEDLASKWKELAAKDIPDVKMVSEDVFQEAVESAKKELIALTLKLCKREATMAEVRKEIERIKVVVADASKVRGKKKPIDGQLAFDFFAEGGLAHA